MVSYKESWEWQLSVLESRKELVRKDEDFEDMVMILQHKPVYTLGTGSSEEFIKFDKNNAPHDIYKTERGGEVTYHGPGQVYKFIHDVIVLVISYGSLSLEISTSSVFSAFNCVSQIKKSIRGSAFCASML